jgi:hypothetical protein
MVATAKPSTNVSTIGERPSTSEPSIIATTKPLVVNNLMLDPSIGTATTLTGAGVGSIGGGGFGGGGGASEPEGAKGEVKKSWLPVILIVIGAFVLITKKKKKD